MTNQGFFLGIINTVLNKSQKLFSNLSWLGNLIQKMIFLTIIIIFVASTSFQSEVLGILALGVLFLTVISMLISEGEKVELNLFEKFIFVWFLIVILSLFGSSLFSLSLKGFFKTLTYMGFYFSVVQFYRKNISLIIPTMAVISFCALSQSLIGISQNFKGVDEISTWQDTSSINPEEVMTRIYGSLKPLNPNLFGGYLVSVLPSVIGCSTYFLSKRRFYLASFFGVDALLCILAIIMSGCRGAYVALMFMLFCFVLYFGKLVYEQHNNLIKKIYVSFVSTVIFLGCSAAFLVTSVRTRILSIFVLRGDSSTSFRFNVYQAVIQMIKDNWLFGIGVGNKNFREIYGLYMRTGFDALSTYNVFTELWVESGIFALLAFFAFLFFLVKDAIIYIMQPKINRIIVAVSVISILSVMVHGLFDTIYFRPQVQFVFWTVTAFISSVLYAENQYRS